MCHDYENRSHIMHEKWHYSKYFQICMKSGITLFKYFQNFSPLSCRMHFNNTTMQPFPRLWQCESVLWHIWTCCFSDTAFLSSLHMTYYVLICVTFLAYGVICLHNEVLNPLKPELNPICYLLALLGAHHFLHVSRIRVKLLTFRLLMS